MRATVVYESMFGNTFTIAGAVAAGLVDGRADVELLAVGDAPLTMRARTGLLVLGAPTHSAGMSVPRSRADAGYWLSADQLVTPDAGVREWLDAVHGDTRLVRCAAFDTRLRRAKNPGSAAHAALVELAHRGFELVAAPESFWVGGMTGPLLPGEVDRARAWGRALSRPLVAPRASRATGTASVVGAGVRRLATGPAPA